MDRVHMFVHFKALEKHRLHNGPSLVKYMEICQCPLLTILLLRLQLHSLWMTLFTIC